MVCDRDGQGRFKTGHSGGRPKGSRNKLPAELVAKVLDTIDRLDAESESGSYLYDLAKAGGQGERLFASIVGRLIPRTSSVELDDRASGLAAIKAEAAELTDAEVSRRLRERWAGRVGT